MDRFSFITYIGAAILVRVAGEMIITDSYIIKIFHNPGHLVSYMVQAACAAGVIVTGKCWLKFRRTHNEPLPVFQNEDNPFYLSNWDIR